MASQITYNVQCSLYNFNKQSNKYSVRLAASAVSAKESVVFTTEKKCRDNSLGQLKFMPVDRQERNACKWEVHIFGLCPSVGGGQQLRRWQRGRPVPRMGRVILKFRCRARSSNTITYPCVRRAGVPLTVWICRTVLPFRLFCCMRPDDSVVGGAASVVSTAPPWSSRCI